MSVFIALSASLQSAAAPLLCTSSIPLSYVLTYYLHTRGIHLTGFDRENEANVFALRDLRLLALSWGALV